NEDNLVYKTLMNAINSVGYSFTLEQILAVAAGKEKKEAIRSVLRTYVGQFDESNISMIYDGFIKNLQIAYETENILPQPGALMLFKKLKENNILSVLDTGYDRTTAESIINKLGWIEGKDFDTLITASDVTQNRPEPDMILLAMKKYGITSGESVVKIGDSSIDIEEGQNAGCCLSIGITTGAHTREQLLAAQPDAIVDNLMEVLDVIKGNHVSA
ncbi:MAG: HAD family hydrolase, partial [Pedobacter sp.]